MLNFYAECTKNNDRHVRKLTESAAYEPDVIGLSGGLDLLYDLLELLCAAGNDHDLETLLIPEMGVYLSLYTVDVLGLNDSHPRVRMIVADGDEDALDRAGHVLHVLHLGDCGLDGGTNGIAASLQFVGFLNLVKKGQILITEGHANYGHKAT